MESSQQAEHRELLEKTQSYLRAQLGQRSAQVEADKAESSDATSWEAFYRLYDVLIRRFVVARGVRGTDVDDCIQDVWADIANRLSGFEITSEAGLRSWIFTLVRSRATDMFRKKSREPKTSLSKSIDDGFEPESREQDPAASFVEEFDAVVVETLMLKLQSEVSELNFEIFRLRSLEGCSVSDTATKCKITVEQVRYRHHRTMQKLKKIAAIYLGRANN